jgi:hypothetical protein
MDPATVAYALGHRSLLVFNATLLRQNCKWLQERRPIPTVPLIESSSRFGFGTLVHLS